MAPILSRLNSGSSSGGFGFGRRKKERIHTQATGGTKVNLKYLTKEVVI